MPHGCVVKAVVANRPGDYALLLFLPEAISFELSGTGCNVEFGAGLFIVLRMTSLSTICLCEVTEIGYGTLLPLLLLQIAAIGKSAQFGLHVWLPDAMETAQRLLPLWPWLIALMISPDASVDLSSPGCIPPA